MFTDMDSIDWNTRTREEAVIHENPIVVYTTSKSLAEKAVWDFAEQHADIQVTTRTFIVSYPNSHVHNIKYYSTTQHVHRASRSWPTNHSWRFESLEHDALNL
jgi:hypothetical protein